MVRLKVIAKSDVIPVEEQEPDHEICQEEGQDFHRNYSDGSHVITKVDHNIAADLKNLQLPEDVKIMADVIYNRMKYQVRRGKKRNQLLN